jgi:transcriptional regulator with XRE-family HTH domain
MNELSARLVELRKTREMSQADLAKAIGVSQGMISRIETAELPPSDLKLLSRIAKVLGVPASELIPEELRTLLQGSDNEGMFFAFCPNPKCPRNKLEFHDDEPVLYWSSGQRFPSEAFVEVNYCRSCGEELIKECKNCKRRLNEADTRYCITCGTQICQRPTAAEWQEIRKMKPPPPTSEESHFKPDEIPF